VWLRLRKSRIGFALSVIALVLATAACDGTDGKLDAVRTFAQNAITAQPAFTAIAADFYASCVRTYYWASGAGETTDTLMNWCGTGTNPPKHALEAMQLWQKTNSVLLSYISGLGALAGGQGSASDYGIPQFTTEITQLAHVTNNQTDVAAANAVSKFSDWIISSYFAERRREELTKVTAEADQYVQSLTASLSDIATKRYGDQLFLEAQELDSFYAKYLPPSTAGAVSPQPQPALSNPVLIVDVLAYRQQWIRDRQTLAERYEAIDAYVDALDKIAKGHSGLVKALQASRLSNPAVAGQLLADFNRDVTMLSHAYQMTGGAR